MADLEGLARAMDALERGGASVEIGLMWLLLAADSPGQAADSLAERVSRAPEPSRLAQARALLAARPGAFDLVQAVAASVNHDDRGEAGSVLTRLRAGFDRAAAVSPDGAAALYSLGASDLLAPVTAEVVAWMRARGLVPPAARVLDVGCGPGRFLAALAPEADLLLGLELSGEMAREGARRLARWPHAAIAQTDGRDLAAVADLAFDLVLFADSFPYLMQAGGGLPEAHLAESARVLRPGGRLLVLNWAYESEVAVHADQARRWGEAAGLAPLELGMRPFHRWDGAAFLFGKTL